MYYLVARSSGGRFVERILGYIMFSPLVSVLMAVACGLGVIIIITRMLLLQATVKRFQFDLYVHLESQHMLISSWFQK